jgi:isopentenyldiphosphate isomerase
MTEEYLDILDDKGNKTGESRPYLEAHEKGLIHSAVHVWIINDKNEVLIQKREKDRRFYPSHWDISAAGHVSSGQTSVEAAIRETKEELGLDVSEQDLFFLGRVYENFATPQFVNKEFDDVYVAKLDIGISDIKLTDGEVAEVRFLSKDQFKNWIDGKSEKMVPHEEYAKILEYLNSQ